MSKERDILKSLLLKEEIELLNTIKQRLLTEEQFTTEVSNVLANALKRAQQKDKKIDRALSIPIKEGVKRAFIDSKQSIIDSMLPIMGQLIRKTVTNSIKQFVTDINRTLELGFSAKAIKWRWQAFRTGIPFARIVFQKTIRYQVLEIFLINRNNGLLIQHVGADEMLKDNHAISGMLTAIQDFVGDSLNEKGANLMSIEIEGKQILISTGPQAYIASVVLGSPTERLKQKFQQLIENIHSDFTDNLLNETEYEELPELNNFLRSNLITKSIEAESKKINWLPWAVTLTLMIVALLYWSYQSSKRYNDLVKAAQSIDGFILQKITKKDSEYLIEGLQDPIADMTSLQKESMRLSTKSFISLDPSIINKRVEKIITEYPEVKIKVIGTTLILTGNTASKNVPILLSMLEKVIGIEHIQNNMVTNQSDKIDAFMDSYPLFNKKSKYELSQNTLLLSGDVTFEELSDFKKNFYQQFPQTSIEDKAVNILDSNKTLINNINQMQINIPEIEKLNFSQTKIKQVIKNLQSLKSRGVKMQLTILGLSDCHGHNSDQFSLLRAQATKEVLINQGIDNKIISTDIIVCDRFSLDTNQAQLNVTFRLKEEK